MRSNKSYCIQIKATEQYFSMMLFVMLCKVVLTVWIKSLMNATEQYFFKNGAF